MQKTENLNWTLIIMVAALIVIGLVNLYSALKVWGEAGFVRLVWLQIAWIGIGSLAVAILAFSDYRIFERLSYPIYIICLVLLLSTLFLGQTVAGHKSWLGIGRIGIQPSEFAKLGTIIVLARHFTYNPHPDGLDFIDLLKPFIIMIIPAALVLLQGDFGSTLFFILLLFSFAWFVKLKRRVILFILIGGIISSVFSYQYILSDYQKARVTTFINPTYDLKGSGYHMMQSRIAVGSGRIFGKGYLKGNVNKLRYLPEKHTDFVFPVLAEEWGFVGCLVTLLFYYGLISMTIEIGRSARDRFGTFLAVGIGAYIFWQIVINIGGVLGLMPLTGVTLPLLSYGGSSTISTLIAIGFLLGVSRKRFVF